MWLEQAEGEMLGEEGRGEEGRESRSGRKTEKDYFQHVWGCVCVGGGELGGGKGEDGGRGH